MHLGRKASQNIDSLQGTESIEPRRSKRPTRTTPATVASMRGGAWVFAMPIFFFLADLTQSGWDWRRCGGCGPWCLESSCSAACTPSCSLWSQPGAARRKQEGRREETIKRTATKSGESRRCRVRDDKDEWREQLEDIKSTRRCLLVFTCKVGSASGNTFSCLTDVTEYYHNVGK